MRRPASPRSTKSSSIPSPVNLASLLPIGNCYRFIIMGFYHCELISLHICTMHKYNLQPRVTIYSFPSELLKAASLPQLPPPPLQRQLEISSDSLLL